MNKNTLTVVIVCAVLVCVIAAAVIVVIAVRADNTAKMPNDGGPRGTAQVSEEAWKALSDEQREEYYALYDKLCADRIIMVEKQLELGLIDEDEADRIIENIGAQAKSMRENGSIPPAGEGYGAMRNGAGAPPPDGAAQFPNREQNKKASAD